MTAVMPPERILSTHPALVPDFSVASLAAFANVFSIHPLLTWIANSLVVGVVATTLSLIVATFAGYSLSRWTSARSRRSARRCCSSS